MSYSPNNVNIFLAAFAGAIAGMGASDKVPTDDDSTSSAVTGIVDVAGAFAQSFDTQWNSASATPFEIETAKELCETAWQERSPQPVSPFLTPNTYNDLSNALIALIHAGDTYLSDNNIVQNTAGIVYVQPNFFVNPLTGNDNNSGATELEPVATYGEVQSRLGNFTVLRVIGSNILTITLLETTPASDPITFRNMMDAGYSAIITGTEKVIHSGTLSSVTNKDRATNIPNKVVDNALAANGWDAYVRYLIKITSTNAKTFVGKNLGAKTAQVQTWIQDSYIIDPTFSWLGDVVVTNTLPIATNTYQIIDYTQATVGDLLVGYNPSNSPAENSPPGGLVIRNLRLFPRISQDLSRASITGPRTIGDAETLASFQDCIFEGTLIMTANSKGAQVANCCFLAGLVTIQTGIVLVQGGLFRPVPGYAENGDYPGGIRQELGVKIEVSLDPGFIGTIADNQAADWQVWGSVAAGPVSFWDTFHGLVIFQGGDFSSQAFEPAGGGESSYVPLWGTGNIDKIFIYPGGTLRFEEFVTTQANPILPSIEMAGPPTVIDMGYGQNIDNDKANAWIPATAEFSLPVELTWTNLLVPAVARPGNGGFLIDNPDPNHFYAAATNPGTGSGVFLTAVIQ